MNTVKEFVEMVLLNRFNSIRIKSADKNCVICEFNNIFDMERYRVEDKKIIDFETDWENKIYILWI